MLDTLSYLAALPIAPHLDGISKALKASQFLVLTAPTGTGKSTAVPIALLKCFTGKIIMLEPRRIAAIAVASRVAQLLGEEIGGTTGYIIKDEKRVSKNTRLTVMTDGVFIRMLQDDPVLEGVDVAVIDEAHERGINTDLSLAFLKETAQLQDDLHILVMSATMDSTAVSKYLSCGCPRVAAAGGVSRGGSPAPVINIPCKQYDVETVYRGSTDKDIAKAAFYAAADEYPLLKKSDAMLVFLPGIKEIRQVQGLLSEKLSAAQIMVLHSSITFDEQRRVLSPPSLDSPPRIILSSAIAEASLTVPGVKTVIDCGLSRINRMNVPSGMSSLVTETESVFSAEQRKGRAGRTGPGKCVRLWEEGDKRIEKADPEILRGDIVPLVLECAQWSGVCDADKLQWLTRPSSGAWDAAQKLLIMLDLLEKKNDKYRITQKGRAALHLGVHPRLACVALAGAGSEESVLRDALSCAIDYSAESAASAYIRRRAEENLFHRVKQVQRTVPECFWQAVYRGKKDASESAAPSRAMMLLSGFPDRLAIKEDNGEHYRFPSGRAASLSSSLRDTRNDAGLKLPRLSNTPQGYDGAGGAPKWIVAPVVDAGCRIGRIIDWKEVSETDAEAFLAVRTEESVEEQFDSSFRLRKTVTACYGKIILSQREGKVTKEEYDAAVCRAVEKEGLEWLPISKSAREFLVRAKFCALHGEKHKGHETDELPSGGDVLNESTMRHTAREWLTPFITGTALTERMTEEALRYCMDGGKVDRLAPRNLILPNGKPCKVFYEAIGEDIRPVAEVIIQRVFGLSETPRIMGVPVTFKLLSPARRPVQVTDDLKGFWHSTWPEVAKEMKGRYPKHDWGYKMDSK